MKTLGKASNVSQILEILENNGMIERGQFAFRGQGDISYHLEPSLFHSKFTDEKKFINSMLVKRPELLRPKEHFHTLSLLRHHEGPSRLLDISFNPLVGVFMALADRDVKHDAALYCFPMKENNGLKDRYEDKKGTRSPKGIKYPTSDTVLVLSCLPFLSKKDQDELKVLCEKHKNTILDSFYFKNYECVHHLYHEISAEYSGFEKEIRTSDLLDFFFVMPPQDDPRIKIQDGFFAFFGLDVEYSTHELEKIASKIIIPKNDKKSILKELEIYGFSNATLYPGFDEDIANELFKYTKKDNK